MSKVEKLDNKHFQQMFDLGMYAFNKAEDEKRRRRFQLLSEKSWGYGVFDGDVLASQAIATPFTVQFGNVKYQMAGIGAVSSYPEYRGHGHISQIMEAMLADINEKGVDLSYLAPFSYPFYRRYGFEYAFERTSYEISASEWPNVPKAAGEVQRSSWEEASPKLAQIFSQMPEHNYGAVVREDWWLEYKFQLGEDYCFAVYYDESGSPAGYLAYLMKETSFEIFEWGYLTAEAFWGLAFFIGSHRSSFQTIRYETGNSAGNFNYLFPNPCHKVSVKPEMMAKIVNIQRFLARFSFRENKDSLAFQLCVAEDSYSKWNEGFYEVVISEEGSAEVKKTEELKAGMPVLKGSIQGLTQLFLSFRPAGELAFFGKIKGDEELIRMLEARLPKQTPVLEDYF